MSENRRRWGGASDQVAGGDDGGHAIGEREMPNRYGKPSAQNKIKSGRKININLILSKISFNLSWIISITIAGTMSNRNGVVTRCTCAMYALLEQPFKR